MNNTHSFDIEIAVKLGSERLAILVKHFNYWICYNARAKKNFHQGKYWMYQTLEEMAYHFPYWSMDQVKRLINQLVQKKVIVKGNFNKTGMDRTVWYSFHEDFEASISKDEMAKSPHHLAKSPNGKSEIANRSIYTNTKTDTKKIRKKDGADRALSEHAFRLSSFLFKKMKENNDKAKEPKFEKWAQDIEKMHKYDGYSYEEIEQLIEFSQEDEFWKTNILSAAKLRDKAPQLLLNRKRSQKQPNTHEKEIVETRSKEIALKYVEANNYFPSQVKLDDNHVKVRVGNGFTVIAYKENAFEEQFRNALRKGGHI